jgi:uncharacterized membrane protein
MLDKTLEQEQNLQSDTHFEDEIKKDSSKEKPAEKISKTVRETVDLIEESNKLLEQNDRLLDEMKKSRKQANGYSVISIIILVIYILLLAYYIFFKLNDQS